MLNRRFAAHISADGINTDNGLFSAAAKLADRGRRVALIGSQGSGKTSFILGMAKDKTLSCLLSDTMFTFSRSRQNLEYVLTDDEALPQGSLVYYAVYPKAEAALLYDGQRALMRALCLCAKADDISEKTLSIRVRNALNDIGALAYDKEVRAPLSMELSLLPTEDIAQLSSAIAKCLIGDDKLIRALKRSVAYADILRQRNGTDGEALHRYFAEVALREPVVRCILPVLWRHICDAVNALIMSLGDAVMAMGGHFAEREGCYELMLDIADDRCTDRNVIKKLNLLCPKQTVFVRAEERYISRGNFLSVRRNGSDIHILRMYEIDIVERDDVTNNVRKIEDALRSLKCDVSVFMHSVMDTGIAYRVAREFFHTTAFSHTAVVVCSKMDATVNSIANIASISGSDTVNRLVAEKTMLYKDELSCLTLGNRSKVKPALSRNIYSYAMDGFVYDGSEYSQENRQYSAVAEDIMSELSSYMTEPLAVSENALYAEYKAVYKGDMVSSQVYSELVIDHCESDACSADDSLALLMDWLNCGEIYSLTGSTAQHNVSFPIALRNMYRASLSDNIELDLHNAGSEIAKQAERVIGYNMGRELSAELARRCYENVRSADPSDGMAEYFRLYTAQLMEQFITDTKYPYSNIKDAVDTTLNRCVRDYLMANTVVIYR